MTIRSLAAVIPFAGLVRIPRYDAVLAAGHGAWNEGRQRLDEVPFTRTFIQKRLGRQNAKGLTILEGVGDSMLPTFGDGALLLIDEENTHRADGIFAFVLDGDARVKRFRWRVNGVTIISDNPAYPPESLEGEDLARIQIIGRLKWFGQTVS